VLLWTRRSGRAAIDSGSLGGRELHAHVATAETALSADTDWTCACSSRDSRLRGYWYRFIDEQGFGSRIDRTLTAPSENDTAPVRFAYGSCQNISEVRTMRTGTDVERRA
jgi:alkaline phosphatase D